MADLPSGFDWGDGLNGRIGTPTPDEAIQVDDAANGADSGLSGISAQEEPDSPQIERAEQATITHNFILSWEEAITRILTLSRGVTLQDSNGNLTKILSANIQRQKGGYAKLSVVAEGLSFDVPPDEISIVPVELGINLLKHPRYFYNLFPSSLIPSGKNGVGGVDTPEETAAKQAIIRALQEFVDSPKYPFQNQNGDFPLLNGQLNDKLFCGIATKKIQYTQPNPYFNPLFSTTPTKPLGWVPTPALSEGDDNPQLIIEAFDGTTSDSVNLALAAATEILTKLWRQEDTPYLVGFQIAWSAYYYVPQPLNPGGYIEDPYFSGSGNPVSVPELPDYFYSRVSPPDPSLTIFDFLTQTNPQCYSANGQKGGPLAISWLRKADNYDYERTWFKITRNWIGSPIGCWDMQLNTQNNRPSSISDYQIIEFPAS